MFGEFTYLLNIFFMFSFILIFLILSLILFKFKLTIFDEFRPNNFWILFLSFFLLIYTLITYRLLTSLKHPQIAKYNVKVEDIFPDRPFYGEVNQFMNPPVGVNFDELINSTFFKYDFPDMTPELVESNFVDAPQELKEAVSKEALAKLNEFYAAHPYVPGEIDFDRNPELVQLNWDAFAVPDSRMDFIYKRSKLDEPYVIGQFDIEDPNSPGGFRLPDDYVNDIWERTAPLEWKLDLYVMENIADYIASTNYDYSFIKKLYIEEAGFYEDTTSFEFIQSFNLGLMFSAPLYIAQLVLAFIFFLFLVISFIAFRRVFINFEFYFLSLLYFFAASVLLVSNSFLNFYVSLELFGLITYVFVAYFKINFINVEASIKYFFFSSFASIVILLGIALIYMLTGVSSITDLCLITSDFTEAGVNRNVNYSEESEEILKEEFLTYKEKLDILGIDFEKYKSLRFDQVLREDDKFIRVLFRKGELIPEEFDENAFIRDLLGDFKGKDEKSMVNNQMFFTGLFLILVGFFIKIGVAPFHFWLIDVYESLAFPLLFLFSLVPKLVYFFVMYMFFYNFILDFYYFFLVFAILSILIGILGGLYQTKLNRLLAYSSVLNNGFFILSFLSSNPGHFYLLFLFYYLNYCLLTFLIMGSLILFLSFSPGYINLNNLADLQKISSYPYFPSIVTFATFSIAGIPPFAGFFLKFFLIYFIFDEVISLTSILILFIGSFVSSVFYLRIVKIVLFEASTSGRISMLASEPVDDNDLYIKPVDDNISSSLLSSILYSLFYATAVNLFFICVIEVLVIIFFL